MLKITLDDLICTIDEKEPDLKSIFDFIGAWCLVTEAIIDITKNTLYMSHEAAVKALREAFDLVIKATEVPAEHRLDYLKMNVEEDKE